METSRLERFAKYARRYLIEQVGNKLQQVLAPDSDARRYYPKQVQAIEEELRRDQSLTHKAYHLSPLSERVAYTWFNRFCALRFMDVNGYNKVNVISPLPGHFQPEILEEAKAGHIDETLVQAKFRTLVFDLLSGKETHPDPQSEAYRILIRSVCNYYADIMPFLFERIEDWTELLMPDDLLSGNSILAYTREAMVPGVCKDVEVIGWLYQFYIAEKKSEVQDGVKKGKKIQSKDIPAVTQLFTPHWIVKYMVQNSLGRLWLDTRPNSQLIDKMEYYVKPESDSDLLRSNEFIEISSPEDIKFCDPCCGSGHILTYAFDLLYEIYSEKGYSPIEIPRLIIEQNLYGIEIDERAAVLSAFALTMKAREKDKLWFSRKIEPHICCLKNIRFSKGEIEPYLDRCGRDIFTLNFERMLSQFEHADTYGSLIIPHEQDIEGIRELLNAKEFSGDVFLAPTHKKVLKLIEQADYLSTKYQVVVTNPPFMGKGMSNQLSKYLNESYRDVKSDLFSAFVFRCAELALDIGNIGIMSPNVWMYLSSYEKLRKWMIQNKSLTNLVELPLSGFTGATVQICAYNFINNQIKDQYGAYVRLVGFKGADVEMASLTKQAVANPNCGWFFRCKTSDFSKIPGAPIAYWVSNKIRDIFVNSEPLAEVASPKVGLQTGDNDRFLRLWFETSYDRIGFGMKNRNEATQSGKKWFPYNKGGEFRKWYGNQEYVVNWANDGEEIRNCTFDNGKQRSVVRNPDYYFRESVSWSFVSSSYFGVRYYPTGFVFDVAGSSCFADRDLSGLLGFLASNLASSFLSILNPTLNFQVGNIKSLPILFNLSDNTTNKTKDQSMIQVETEKLDWNSFETSWDFQQLPLLGIRCQGLGIRECYAKLREQWIENTLRMQELEEKNNEIFIDAYGLKGEIEPEVSLREITLSCNPYYRYGVEEESGVREFPINEELEKRLVADTMKELISYSVGCMFGRYSLDKPGLILANQGETLEDFLKQVSKPCFMPDKDNVIPILNGEWFDDDIVNRFHAFLKVAFGTDHFSQNIGYIEEAIGKDIRTYFIKDFYNDHVKMYKKRPIYWLFSSPKGSFNALVYMHRYTPDTASIVLSDYLREYVFKLKNKVTELSKIEEGGDSSQKEKIKARKEIDKIEQIISELEYWERDALYSTAAQKISIDLDDGVKVNYAKFSKVLKRIPGLE
ncbi:MAG TPA: BREX-1 system adenine-specific DNA-methyltransferase PglX [Candidatus Cloacimonadota bacterium]|mgnify:FL=1|nr:BREX-1 system adenine-specific DNA-methyltransferase PglX [Candidatus Cloacimonadota bacterium]